MEAEYIKMCQLVLYSPLAILINIVICYLINIGFPNVRQCLRFITLNTAERTQGLIAQRSSSAGAAFCDPLQEHC